MATAMSLSLRARTDKTQLGIERRVRQERRANAAGKRLVCRLCGAFITTDADRLRVSGSHVHRRTNPAGIEFEFGCFAEAPGGQVTGQPTTEFSWFAGHAWSFCLCARCAAHLGWHFEGGEPRPFFGLILDRLDEADGA